MKMILNELSIDGQFENEGEFEDYYVGCLLEVFKFLDELIVCLYKKMDTYNRKITSDETILDLIREVNNPVATSIKKYLIELAYEEPYWDDEKSIESDIENNTYECKYSSDFPNCFSEALERKSNMLSLRHDDYMEECLECSKNGKAFIINNVQNKNDLLLLYLKEDIKNMKYVIERMDFEKKVELFQDGNNCQVLQDILKSNLDNMDALKIVQKLPILISEKMLGRENHFYDKIDDDLDEYRLTVSGNREFRLFFLWKEKIIFLNGGIKKQQKPNKLDRQRADRLRKRYEALNGHK